MELELCRFAGIMICVPIFVNGGERCFETDRIYSITSFYSSNYED